MNNTRERILSILRATGRTGIESVIAYLESFKNVALCQYTKRFLAASCTEEFVCFVPRAVLK